MKREGDQLRLFGLDIVPAKKVDQREAKVFDKIVMELASSMIDYEHFLKTIDPDDMTKLEPSQWFAMIEDIQSLFNIYEANKFTYPSSCFPYGYHLNQLISVSKHIYRSVMTYRRGVLVRDLADEHDTNEMNVDELEDVMDRVYEQIQGLIQLALEHLSVMELVIREDVLKVVNDVDIIRDYHLRKKRMTKTGDEHIQYTVKFTRVKPKKSSGGTNHE